MRFFVFNMFFLVGNHGQQFEKCVIILEMANPKRAAAEVHAKFCDDDPIGQRILRVEVQKDTGCLHDAQTLNESERHAKSEVSVIL